MLVRMIGPRSMRANKYAPATETINSTTNKPKMPRRGRLESRIGCAGKYEMVPTTTINNVVLMAFLSESPIER